MPLATALLEQVAALAPGMKIFRYRILLVVGLLIGMQHNQLIPQLEQQYSRVWKQHQRRDRRLEPSSFDCYQSTWYGKESDERENTTTSQARKFPQRHSKGSIRLGKIKIHWMGSGQG